MKKCQDKKYSTKEVKKIEKAIREGYNDAKKFLAKEEKKKTSTFHFHFL